MLFSQICAFLPIALLLVNCAPIANKEFNSKRQVTSPDSDFEFDPADPDYGVAVYAKGGFQSKSKREAYYTYAPSLDSEVKRSQDSTNTAELENSYAQIPPYGVIARDSDEEGSDGSYTFGISGSFPFGEEGKREIIARDSDEEGSDGSYTFGISGSFPFGEEEKREIIARDVSEEEGSDKSYTFGISGSFPFGQEEKREVASSEDMGEADFDIGYGVSYGKAFDDGEEKREVQEGI